jgi:hypothetical protein
MNIKPNLLIPRSRVLEKLTFAFLVKKFPALYETERFIHYHLSLSWDKCSPCYPQILFL